MAGPAIFVVRKEMNIVRPFCVKVHRTPETIKLEYFRRHEIDGKIHDFLVTGALLDLEKLRKRVDWKDGTQYGWHLKSYDIQAMHAISNLIDQMVAQGMNPEDIPTAVEMAVPRYGTVNRNGYFINISAALQNGRVSSLEGHGLIPAFRMLNFTIKFKDSTFDKIMVSLNIDPACPLEVTSGDEVVHVINSMEIYQKLRKEREDIKDLVWRPKLKMTFSEEKNGVSLAEWHSRLKLEPTDHPDADMCISEKLIDQNGFWYVWVDIQLVREWDGTPYPHTAEVYLENVNGYLPKNRIILDDQGRASFKVSPMLLDKGDTMRVKAGFRYQTGIADFAIEVV